MSQFFLVDDAWYYFEVAQRAATEGRLTFDGLNTTNGFHPLWLLMLFLFALVGANGPFPALIAQAALTGCGLTARGSGRELAAFVAIVGSFHGLKIYLGGMEAALAFALVAWVLRTAESKPTAWAFGLLTGLAITARWTNAVLLAPVVFMVFRDFGLRERGVAVVIGGLPVGAALVASWMLTGHLVPVSAAIKTGNPGGLFHWAFALGLAGFALALTWRQRNEPSRVLAGLGAGLMLITAADLALRRTLVPEIWTLWPHVLLLMGLARFLNRRHAAATSALALGVAGVSWAHRLSPEASTAYEAAARTGDWLEFNTPAPSVAAGWDVGFIAGHTSRSVVNLDGLVNSWEFKAHVLDRHRLDDYLLNELKPDFIAQDVPVSFLRRDVSIAFKGAHLGGWFVERAECFSFRSAVQPWVRQHKVALVLSRTARTTTARTLSSQRLELCAEQP